jgi:high-affinity Fe2+/Pb2+ permease
MSIENRLFPDPGDSFQRRQFRALKAALLVGLVCAAVLALVLYALCSKGKP